MKTIRYAGMALAVLTLDGAVAYRLHEGSATEYDAMAFIGVHVALLFLLALKTLNRRIGRILACAVGVQIAAFGFLLLTQTSPQVDAYNKALAAMQNDELPAAIKLFDESVAAHKKLADRSLPARLFAPKVRKDLEALALFHKANCLVKLNKGKEAVEALKKSLQSNPGNCYSGLDLAGAQRRYLEALETQSNLEKLFKSGQGGGHATGPGGGQGQPQPGQQPGRERQPQPGSGKQERDAL